jgi:hypothetical protein
VATESVLYDVCDAKVYKLLTDVSGASAPSYGAAIDIPGIGAMSGFDPQIISNSLKGDCRVIARRGFIESVNFSVVYGKIARDVISAINDASIWDDGDDHGVRLKAGAETNYFKFEGIVTGTDAGVDQVKFVAYKSSATSQTLADQSSDNYGQPKFDANAIGIDSGTASAPPDLEKDTLVDVIITDE